MDRQYKHDEQEFELVIKLKNGETSSFFGTWELTNGKKLGEVISLYTNKELIRRGENHYNIKLCPMIPNGDLKLTVENGYVVIRRNEELLDMIMRDTIEEISTLVNGKIVD